ncbi:histidine kinase [Amycolatopsis carbonis]|uniref:histidine kinase n=1 Tax=Amycolatopsis carbonis TaxID=715471 RepID=A0A9Y2N114_9PSEU|nr:histidine kinase [Amycolatopsis sp. 2-15]WIX82599.1 histidine kinase [Amycolatopsis sp. 2-15]
MRSAWKWAAPAALVVLALVDAGAGVLQMPSRMPWYGPCGLVTAVLATAAWLRPHSMLATAAGAASITTTWLFGTSGQEVNTDWGLVETAALLGVLFTTTIRLRSWRAAPLVALVLVAVTTQPLQKGFTDHAVIFSLVLLFIATSTTAVAAYLKLVRTAREAEIGTVKAEQRAEFARDLHDFVAHHVTGIVVLAQGAHEVVDEEPEAVAQALQEIQDAGGEAMTAMRRMVGMLRSPDADAAPLAPLAGLPELTALVDGFDRPRARLRVEGSLDDVPPEVASSAYRVVLESLTNVHRHARKATAVDVDLHRQESELQVRVRNDGRTVRGGHGGFGLVGLAERVEALGGRFVAGPDEGGGWLVDAALPLTGASA